MKLKKAVSIAANIVGFFKYSVAVTVVKKGSLNENGLIQIYDHSEPQL